MTPPVTYTREDLDKFKFKVPSRVMMSHTDQEGIVNNISFFTYLELGRFEYFRNIGMTLSTIKSQGTGMAMVESSCRFLSPLFFDDEIEIYVRIDYMGDSSFHVKYLIFAPEREIVAAQGHTVSVFLDPHTRKTKLMPRQFREKVLAFEGDGSVKLK
jgi:acyl-CoA thioester hydrolase